MVRPSNKDEFVFIDVETTGLSPQQGDRVIEIAALKTKGKKIVNRFHSLVDPKRELTLQAYMVNRITPEMLLGAPTAKEIMPEFQEFIAGMIIVGHNVKFDLGFINNEFELVGLSPLQDAVAIDTIRMARGIIPEALTFSLGAVGNYLQIKNTQAHRAMGDVEVTCSVFHELVKRATSRGIEGTDTLINLFGTKRSAAVNRRSTLQSISQAIDNNSRLEILYFSRTSGTTTRKVTPTKLLGDGAEAVMVGYCHLRKEERIFRVDRILKLVEA